MKRATARDRSRQAKRNVASRKAKAAAEAKAAFEAGYFQKRTAKKRVSVVTGQQLSLAALEAMVAAMEPKYANRFRGV